MELKMTGKHLWEIDHPYYMTEGCFFSNDCHQGFESWQGFHEEWGDADEDYNMLIRWDWKNEDDGQDILLIQFFLQRKAYPISCRIKVKKEQEGEIRAYLSKKAEYIKKMWEPFL
jgi:hypothetical protein